ncbi:MAG: tyrosine--tRNA ligase [Ignavibacteria bacterium]|nr:tyrosine--tRNA ligase [Ignavibacteria bacterium]
MIASLNEQMDILKKGTVEIIPEDELVRKLENSIKNKSPLKIKLGCDPSVPDLHIGHAVVLNKLREFQDFGHTAILIIGDYTGMIGDPSGKKKTRPQLTYEETRENGKSYFDQASVILDRDKTKILYNSEWLSKIDLKEMINLLGKFTVQRILERDDFTNRLREQVEISMHELLYPIMQGYDSYAIDADVELGGTDQKFNNLVGRDMQKRFGKEPQVVLLMPLLEGTDGSEKMSKSLNNYIGITDSPRDMFGKAMSIPDVLIYKYFTLATRLTPKILSEIKKELESPETNPRNAKRRLGFELVKLYYNENTANDAISEFDRIFIKKEIPDEIPELIHKSSEIKLISLMVENKLAESNSTPSVVALVISGKGEYVLKVGKRKFLKVKIN